MVVLVLWSRLIAKLDELVLGEYSQLIRTRASTCFLAGLIICHTDQVKTYNALQYRSLAARATESTDRRVSVVRPRDVVCDYAYLIEHGRIRMLLNAIEIWGAWSGTTRLGQIRRSINQEDDPCPQNLSLCRGWTVLTTATEYPRRVELELSSPPLAGPACA